MHGHVLLKGECVSEDHGGAFFSVLFSLLFCFWFELCNCGRIGPITGFFFFFFNGSITESLTKLLQGFLFFFDK